MQRSKKGNRMGARLVSFLLGVGLPALMQGVALASEGAAEGGHGGGHGLNWTDFALRTVNFLLMAGILYKLLSKPIATFFTSRREDIQKLLAELDQKKAEAEKKSAEYRSKLGALESETKKIVSELIAEGETERQKIIEAAERQAEYIKQQAQLSIQQEVKAARESLQEEISEMSVTAAEKILRENMKAKDQDRLVRDFMKRVVEAK